MLIFVSINFSLANGIMKIIFTLVSILCFHACLAQTSTQEVLYTKNLDDYVGTWQYATLTDTFQIAFRKGIRSLKHSYSECLIGGYRYVKNGILVADFTDFPSKFSDKDFSKDDLSITVMGTNSKVNLDRVESNKIRIFFKDRGLNKTGVGQMLLLRSATQAHWTLEDDEGNHIIWPGRAPWVDGFSVPTDVTLIKISDDYKPRRPKELLDNPVLQ